MFSFNDILTLIVALDASQHFIKSWVWTCASLILSSVVHSWLEWECGNNTVITIKAFQELLLDTESVFTVFLLVLWGFFCNISPFESCVLHVIWKRSEKYAQNQCKDSRHYPVWYSKILYIIESQVF